MLTHTLRTVILRVTVNHLVNSSSVFQPTLSVSPVRLLSVLRQRGKLARFGVEKSMSSGSHSESKNSSRPSDETMGTSKSKPKDLTDKVVTGKPVTRKAVDEQEKSWRDHYLNMTLAEKREVYKCGNKYVTLDETQMWSDYARENIMAKDAQRVKPEHEVDEKLNLDICLWRGDITKLEIDAIVNAANNSLLGGGGVDGAIHRAAGSKLREECARLRGCPTGEAKITGGYKMPAKYIIHTVGPIGEHKTDLSSCYKNSLDLVKKHNLRTVAFPCISTGIYGYDVTKATPVVMTTVRQWLIKNPDSIDRIIFCVFLLKDVEVYQNNLLKYFPPGVTPPDRNRASKETKKPRTKDTKQKKSDKESKSISEDKITTRSSSRVSDTDTKPTLKRNKEDTKDATGKQTESSNTTTVNDENSSAVSNVDSDKIDTDKGTVKMIDEGEKEKGNGGKDSDDSSPAAKKKPPVPADEKKKSVSEKTSKKDVAEISSL